MTPLLLYMFAAAMLGHFVGDYTFQNQWMAVGKSHKGWYGHLCCTVHVFLYTLAVAMFTAGSSNHLSSNRFLLFLLVVAVPHWIIDRWSLAKYILWLKNGYWPFEVWEKAPVCAAPRPDQLESNVWKVAFAAPVYIFNDNVLHWVCLWFTCKYFFHG